MKLKYNPKNENSLEEIWIKLSKLYESQADEYIENQKDKFNILTNVQSALNELKVGLETMDLVEKGNITKIPIQNQNTFKNNYSLKIENISSIILKSKKIIEDFLIKENKIFSILKYLGNLSINKGIINLEALNSKIQITFDGEILNYKFQNKSNERTINYFDFNEFLFKEKEKKIKKDFSKIFVVEKIPFNENFQFFKSYFIKLEYNEVLIYQQFFCGVNFKEIFLNSLFVSKVQGKYNFKKIFIEISGEPLEIINIKNEYSLHKYEVNRFISWLNNSLMNGKNLGELFFQIEKYVCYFVLKNVKKCKEIFYEDDCYYGISEDIYRIDEYLNIFKNEIKEN